MISLFLLDYYDFYSTTVVPYIQCVTTLLYILTLHWLCNAVWFQICVSKGVYIKQNSGM